MEKLSSPSLSEHASRDESYEDSCKRPFSPPQPFSPNKKMAIVAPYRKGLLGQQDLAPSVTTQGFLSLQTQHAPGEVGGEAAGRDFTNNMWKLERSVATCSQQASNLSPLSPHPNTEASFLSPTPRVSPPVNSQQSPFVESSKQTGAMDITLKPQPTTLPISPTVWQPPIAMPTSTPNQSMAGPYPLGIPAMTTPPFRDRAIPYGNNQTPHGLVSSPFQRTLTYPDQVSVTGMHHPQQQTLTRQVSPPHLSTVSSSLQAAPTTPSPLPLPPCQTPATQPNCPEGQYHIGSNPGADTSTMSQRNHMILIDARPAVHSGSVLMPDVGGRDELFHGMDRVSVEAAGGLLEARMSADVLSDSEAGPGALIGIGDDPNHPPYCPQVGGVRRVIGSSY